MTNNSVAPDQTPFALDLHCLLRSVWANTSGKHGFYSMYYFIISFTTIGDNSWHSKNSVDPDETAHLTFSLSTLHINFFPMCV